jgi:hypothetical protein
MKHVPFAQLEFKFKVCTYFVIIFQFTQARMVHCNQDTLISVINSEWDGQSMKMGARFAQFEMGDTFSQKKFAREIKSSINIFSKENIQTSGGGGGGWNIPKVQTRYFINGTEAKE